ncbi:putativelike family protein [Diaporthe ampelina]|uniref:Putativelike family protein n=1 Tax=Diaporthe ampelina TaxID=1214573 RepID=A0A0G2FMR0_9PEZI|nr:putativelike family protein [Diaporthe ampelina]
MAAKYDSVIVFGPTGAVGGSAALEASKRGAKVWLAMRNTSKAIEEIPADIENSGAFERVQADLTDPGSVETAIKKSGAKAAYLYLIFGSPDNMRGSLQAMKDAGVEYVVFLSSVTITRGKDFRSFSPEHFVSWSHAQVELALEEIGFPHVTALRPAVFASNHFNMELDRSAKPPRANITYEDTLMDNIVPFDIGAVGGAVLVERPSNGKEMIYLCGPQQTTFKDVWETIKRVTGRDDLDTTPIDPEEWLARASQNMPLSTAKELLRIYEEWRDPEGMLPKPEYQQAVANIKKFSGREPTKFEDYIEAHKAQWQAI